MSGQSGIYLPPDLYKPFHMVAWSYSPKRHFSWIHSASPHIRLDNALRSSNNYYHWPWQTDWIPLFQELYRILGISLIRTTSYHSASNRMIERFHRQLKAALRANPDQQRWSEYVPIVLLGCRAAIKEDLGYSPAELVYGVPLSLPDQMLNPIDLTGTDPALYINRLRAYFGKLSPMHPREQTIKSLVSKDISLWTHVFLRKDAVKALSHHLTLALTAYFHALTNLSPLTLMAKKKLYLLTRWKEPFLTQTHKSHIPIYTHEHTLTPIERKHNAKRQLRYYHTYWSTSTLAKKTVQNCICIKCTLRCFYGCYLFLCRLSA